MSLTMKERPTPGESRRFAKDRNTKADDTWPRCLSEDDLKNRATYMRLGALSYMWLYGKTPPPLLLLRLAEQVLVDHPEPRTGKVLAGYAVQVFGEIDRACGHFGTATPENLDELWAGSFLQTVKRGNKPETMSKAGVDTKVDTARWLCEAGVKIGEVQPADFAQWRRASKTIITISAAGLDLPSMEVQDVLHALTALLRSTDEILPSQAEMKKKKLGVRRALAAIAVLDLYAALGRKPIVLQDIKVVATKPLVLEHSGVRVEVPTLVAEHMRPLLNGYHSLPGYLFRSTMKSPDVQLDRRNLNDAIMKGGLGKGTSSPLLDGDGLVLWTSLVAATSRPARRKDVLTPENSAPAWLRSTLEALEVNAKRIGLRALEKRVELRALAAVALAGSGILRMDGDLCRVTVEQRKPLLLGIPGGDEKGSLRARAPSRWVADAVQPWLDARGITSGIIMLGTRDIDNAISNGESLSTTVTPILKRCAPSSLSTLTAIAQRSKQSAGGTAQEAPQGVVPSQELQRTYRKFEAFFTAHRDVWGHLILAWGELRRMGQPLTGTGLLENYHGPTSIPAQYGDLYVRTILKHYDGVKKVEFKLPPEVMALDFQWSKLARFLVKGAQRVDGRRLTED